MAGQLAVAHAAGNLRYGVLALVSPHVECGDAVTCHLDGIAGIIIEVIYDTRLVAVRIIRIYRIEPYVKNGVGKEASVLLPVADPAAA